MIKIFLTLILMVLTLSSNTIDAKQLFNIQKVKGKRKITEIAEIQGYDYTTNEFKLKSVKGRENGDSIL